MWSGQPTRPGARAPAGCGLPSSSWPGRRVLAGRPSPQGAGPSAARMPPFPPGRHGRAGGRGGARAELVLAGRVAGQRPGPRRAGAGREGARGPQVGLQQPPRPPGLPAGRSARPSGPGGCGGCLHTAYTPVSIQCVYTPATSTCVCVTRGQRSGIIPDHVIGQNARYLVDTLPGCGMPWSRASVQASQVCVISTLLSPGHLFPRPCPSSISRFLARQSVRCCTSETTKSPANSQDRPGESWHPASEAKGDTLDGTLRVRRP